MIEVQSRIGGARRCPLCQEPIHAAGAGGTQACGGCQTLYHQACLTELGGCSTLGCPARVPRGASPQPPPIQAQPTGLEGSPGPGAGGFHGFHARRPAAERASRYDDAFGPDVERLPDGCVKLELDTFLESLWVMVGIFAFVGAVVSGIMYFSSGEAGIWLGVSVLILVASIVCGNNTDNYYVADPQQRAILYRWQFFSLGGVRHVASFEDVLAVTMNGRKESTKQRSWWEYCVVIVLNNGKAIRVGDWIEDTYAAVHRTVESLAPGFGAPAIPAPLQSVLKVKRNRHTREFEISHGKPDHFLLMMLIIGAVGAAITIASLLG